jgi:hypothetical protein
MATSGGAGQNPDPDITDLPKELLAWYLALPEDQKTVLRKVRRALTDKGASEHYKAQVV